MKTVSTLPKILYFIEKTTSAGTTSCPHCGATGRHVFRFMCEDGKVRGAMSGCVQLFPQTQTAKRTSVVVERVERYRRSEWNPRREDLAVLDAIVARASASEIETLLYAAEAKAGAAQWKMQRRGRR